MRFATRTVLGAFVLLLAGSAQAQDKNVTFQVDLTPYITSCQFDDSEEDVVVRGNFNDWAGDANKLADDDENGTFTGTFAFAEGTELAYKFVTIGKANSLAFEDDTDNRTYTVGADEDQTIDLVTFADGDPVDACAPGSTAAIEVLFTVNMNVAEDRGTFDPSTQTVFAAGSWNGFNAAEAVALTESTSEDGVYTGVGQFDAIATPSTITYKFITKDGDGNVGWETIADQEIDVPENPTDGDGNDFAEVAGPDRFFDNVSFDQVLENPAAVTFRVDLRPAEYFLADSMKALPGGGPASVAELTGLFLNGPALWESTEAGGPAGGITDWVGWGTDGLGSTDAASFTEDSDNDGFWELTLNYPAGALRTLVGKLGANGFDNANGFGENLILSIEDGATVDLVFGAFTDADGFYGDNPSYDPYILFDNTANPPTVMSVRNGGENDVVVGIEDGPGIDGLAIGAAYPNPTRGAASLDLTLDRALDLRVTLYDVVGRQVATLADGPAPAGDTTLGLDVSGLAPGVYLLRVEADGQAVTRRMTVLR